METCRHRQRCMCTAPKLGVAVKASRIKQQPAASSACSVGTAAMASCKAASAPQARVSRFGSICVHHKSADRHHVSSSSLCSCDGCAQCTLPTRPRCMGQQPCQASELLTSAATSPLMAGGSRTALAAPSQALPLQEVHQATVAVCLPHPVSTAPLTPSLPILLLPARQAPPARGSQAAVHC